MLGYIVVTAAAYFGRADEHGQWAVQELTPGRVRVRVWHPLLNEPGELDRVIEVRGEREAVEFRLTKPLRPAPLTGRAHSWDY
jgi:hypothetical protein